MPEVLFQREDEIRGEDAKDTELLRGMADRAVAYVQSFSWCPGIQNVHLAFGIGGVVGLFLVEFASKIAGTGARIFPPCSNCGAIRVPFA